MSEPATAHHDPSAGAAAWPTAGERVRRGVPGWVAVPVLLVLLAVGVAVAWWAIVPDTPVVAVEGLVASRGPSDDVLATADGSFAALCLVAGALAAIALLVRPGEFLLRRASVALVGGTLAAVVAWQLGGLIGPASLAKQQEAGVEVLRAPLDLTTPLVVLLWPGATACLLFVGLLAWLLISPPADS